MRKNERKKRKTPKVLLLLELVCLETKMGYKICDDPKLRAVIKEFNKNLLNNYTNLIKDLQNL